MSEFDTTDEHDKTYENESNRDYSPMVSISLKEYDKLKESQGYIKDKTLIDIIDNIERLVRALRKHIIRHDLEENFQTIKKKESE